MSFPFEIKHLRFHFSLVAGILASCVSGPTQAQHVDARLQAAFKKINAELVSAADSSDFVGAVVGITGRTRLIHISAYGMADLKNKTPMKISSHFAIGSLSKSFTSIALLRLSDIDRFDPKKPISFVLPWFTTDLRYAPITGAQLLSHTASLPSYRPDLSSSRAAAFAMRDWEMPYSPGTHFAYSNLGYQILGYAFEDITQRSYSSALATYVLEPLGMNSSSGVIDDAGRKELAISYVHDDPTSGWVEAPWFEYSAGDGGVVSTAADMSAYMRMLLNRGQTPRGLFLSEKSFALLSTPGLGDYGYGLFVNKVDGGTVLHHVGSIGGFRSHMEVRLDDGFGVIFLCNSAYNRQLAEWIGSTIHNGMRGLPLPPAPPHAKPMAPLTHFVGSFTDAVGQTLTFRMGHNGLQLSNGGKIAYLRRLGNSTFAADEADDALIFAEEEGIVTGVSQGSSWYSTGIVPPAPSSFRSLVGHYDAHNFEGPQLRVFVRNGALIMRTLGEGGGWDEVLVPTGIGSFRPATPSDTPERRVFDTMVNGKALRILISGQPVYRVATP